MQLATTGHPSISKDLQGLFGPAVSLVTHFQLARRFPCTPMPSGMSSHCRCCSEGKEHTHPSLPSTCSWMYRLCQCLWDGWDWGAPQSWGILLFLWGNICRRRQAAENGDALTSTDYPAEMLNMEKSIYTAFASPGSRVMGAV